MSTPEERRQRHIKAMWESKKPEVLLDEDGHPIAIIPSTSDKYDNMLAYFDEHEPAVANIIRNGPPSVERLVAIIREGKSHPTDSTSERMARLILEELSK